MREEKLYRIMAAALMVAAASVSGYHRHKAERASQEKSSASALKEEGLPTAIALRSSGLVLVLSVVAYILNPRWMKWSSLEVPPWLRWSGAGLGTATLPLSWWVFRTIGENITPSVTTRKDHALVTGGPYRWVRHPLYSVGTTFFASLSVLAANWFMGLVSLSVLVMLIVRLPKEEEKLIERFGEEYREYIQRTGRLLPPFGRGSG
jgi:protein-S-isoprenylcysteine O-methyltransferase Ste14